MELDRCLVLLGCLLALGYQRIDATGYGQCVGKTHRHEQRTDVVRAVV
jgi:hypothetical protein